MIKSPSPTFNDWLAAARLRTLPLAFAVIILGSGLAHFEHPESWNWALFGLALFTAFSYQVLSNYANDLGDGLRGTDENRRGEARAVAAGIISIAQMRGAVLLFTVLSLLSGTMLSYLAFEGQPMLMIAFIVLGALATWAARSYTMGTNPYAYWGGGDFFVFIFFGLVGTLGSAALYGPVRWYFVLPAIISGALSAAVLTLNNLRDEVGDKESGKHTLVVRFGQRWGRGYFKTLLIVAMLLNLVFAIIAAYQVKFSAIIVFHLIFMVGIRQLFRAFKVRREPEELDTLLKPTALLTLAYCAGTAITLLF